MYNNELRFSLWCDFVERNFLENEFSNLIEKNIVNAATSNPSIFKSAFLGSPAYKEAKALLEGRPAKEIYETLAIQDIQCAASKLLSAYESGNDGFISIEVDPFLCDDAQATIEEGKRLYQAIGYPNVMIKVPATEAGFVAMETFLSEGMHVNATLVFSHQQAKSCLDAFARANALLENKSIQKLPQAVISIFVSRFDRKLDAKLETIDFPTGRVGIMNALRCYDVIEEHGFKNVRALFASTGVKGDRLREDYYIQELLVKNAINTAPLNTIHAFVSSKEELLPIEYTQEMVENFFNALHANDIDINHVCDELMDEGLRAFKEAFVEILNELK